MFVVSIFLWLEQALFVFFFFFKQKTAYEMRISDWSSDVCSSDLLEARDLDLLALERPRLDRRAVRVVARIEALAARRQPIERRLREIEVPLAHQFGHFLEEEGHLQGRDVRAVDIGVGPDDDEFGVPIVGHAVPAGCAAQRPDPKNGRGAGWGRG